MFGGGWDMQFFCLCGGGGNQRRVQGPNMALNPIMAPFPEYLSAVMSTDVSADAQARINIRK